MAKLRRLRDGEGFAGARSEAIKYDEKGLFEKIVSDKPTVGCCMLVGTISASSYSNRDFWITTLVTEILEEKDGYVRFKTKNSEYEWWAN
jgi:hypothetical protein